MRELGREKLVLNCDVSQLSLVSSTSRHLLQHSLPTRTSQLMRGTVFLLFKICPVSLNLIDLALEDSGFVTDFGQARLM